MFPVLHLQAPADCDKPPGAGESVRPLLAARQLHEIHAGAPDWAGALAFALAAVPAREGGPIVLVRGRRKGRADGASGMKAALVPCGEGLGALGVDPGRLVIVDAPDDAALLRAGLDAARSGGPGAVIMESWGPLRAYDLVASRRLILAAEASGLPLVMLRGDAEPRSSAAHTRWAVSSAPSDPLEMRAPGQPALFVDLLRRRGGPAGMRWRLEWNEDDGEFREHLLPSRPDITATEAGEQQPAPLSGAVVPLPAVRAGAPLRRTA